MYSEQWGLNANRLQFWICYWHYSLISCADTYFVLDVSTSPGGSDHCPIQITFINQNIPDNEQTIRWNYKRTDWTKYSNDEVWMNTPGIGITDNELLILNLYHRFHQAAQNSIPTFKPTKYMPKPWWTNELKLSKARRERLYQDYRRNKSLNN